MDKTDMKKESCQARLERADLSRAVKETGLHSQLGHKLRNVFDTPATLSAEFEALMERISSVLP